MKKAEGIGAIIGSILGAVGTGIAIYYTESPLSSIIGLLGYLVGSQIGKSIDKNK